MRVSAHCCLLLGLAAAALACGETEVPRKAAAPVWPSSAHLVETARIGVDVGDEAEMFASVSSIWASLDRTYVVDSAAPAVRVFSSDGEYLRQVGRRGEGPGEYIRPLAVAVAPDDQVLVLDSDPRARIQFYSPPDGRYSHYLRYRTTEILNGPFLVDARGDIYAPTGIWRENSESREIIRGFTRIGADGSADPPTLFARDPGSEDEWTLRLADGRPMGRVPFAPATHWAVGPGGMTVVGESSAYAFTVTHPDGSTVSVRRSVDPVRIAEEEAAYYRASRIQGVRGLFPGWTWDGPGIPAKKPAYTRFLISSTGQIWVVRQGAGHRVPGCTVRSPESKELINCWANDGYFDVFEPDGMYLGELAIPDEIGSLTVSYVGDGFLMARVESESGVLQVVRYDVVVSE